METVTLNSTHKKKEFSCGEGSLDSYIKIQAGQDQKKRVSICFVLAEGDGMIKGYYTLANDSISRDSIPASLGKTMPYKKLPVTLIGRLARDERYKGGGIGPWLVVDALKKALRVSDEISSIAVVVDPLHEKAADFYEKFGFVKLQDTTRMFMSMETIRDAFEEKTKGKK